MFGKIAGRYDLLNHLLSVNIDKRWRRKVAGKISQAISSQSDSEPRILDIACGTGDLSLALFDGDQARIIGIDFCRPMLRVAASKTAKNGAPIRFVEGDALQLPFADGEFAAATIAFGLRNLASVEAGLEEFWRVLKPGGKLVVLEFSKPRIPVLQSLFKLYFTKLLPILGGLISGSRSAYEYLPDSVMNFPDQKALAAIMERAGFREVDFENLSGGIAAVHVGTRPAV
jgi:demethylmenaquinone methyltransferase / 2-methoxy-6-polyprenyl-1,4-benzoquinol methylase